MAKNYLSLKKAAELLGIQNSELVQLREKGEIRGFADRGTWKFKLDDLEEFNRRQQADSDPDVPILADSDVDLSEDLIGASDSDVRLILDEDLVADASDSDVTLVPSDDSGVGRAGAARGEGSSVKLDESGISLAAESGVALQAPDDSGLTLAGEDSGLTLAEADSGLSLEDAAADSGITLEKSAAAGKRPADATVPMLDSPLLEGGTDETELDVPTVDSQDNEFELGLDDESFDLEETTEEDFLESPAFDDELEVTDDVVGEDDELDVFDADDEVFEEALETGESHADFIAPRAGRMAAPVEADWGTPMFVGLACSTVLMTLCCIMMFDLVRSMWGWHDPNPLSNGLVEVFSSLFG